VRSIGLIVVLTTACRVDSTLDGQFRCDDGVSCPSGLVCRALECVPPGTSGDGGRRDAAVASDGPRVDGGLADFGPATAVAELNSANGDDDPTLTFDQREIYFESNRDPSAGGGDIWRAVRATTDEPFGEPAIVVELSSVDQDGTPEVTPDGLTIYLHSDRPGGLGADDIWVSTRADRADPWPMPVLVPELSSASGEGAPVTAGPLTVVFASNRPGTSGDFDLFTAARAGADQTFGDADPVPGINTAMVESEPWIDPGGTVLYFTSTRPGGMGLGDLWVATRSDASAPFSTPILVDSLATSAHEADAWLSPDLRTIWFSRNLNGTPDIYTATR
jgi:hypothetical protein